MYLLTVLLFSSFLYALTVLLCQNSGANAATEPAVVASSAPETTSAPESTAAENANTQIDNEVSQINEILAIEKPLDASITANAQVCFY